MSIFSNFQHITINSPLVKKFTSLFSRQPLTPRHTPRTDTTESSHNVSEYYYRKVLLENTRKAQYADYRTMDDDYVEIAAALDMYADYATKEQDEEGDVFELLCDDPKAKNILEELYDRIRLMDILWDTARGIAKMGDEYDEVVVNAKNLIVRLKGLPPESISIDMDDYGIWKEKPYIQKDVDSGAKIADFWPWQIIHWKLGNTKRLYGGSILKPIRRVYKQVQLMEDGTVIALLTRAHLRYKFLVDAEGLTAEEAREKLLDTKEDVKKKRLINPHTNQLDVTQNPLSAADDFFLTVTKDSKADVGVVQGMANFASIIAGVKYFQNKMFIGLKTPESLFGVMEGKIRASIIEQAIQFATAVGRLRKSMRRGVTKLSDRQLLILGVVPNKDLYDLNFPHVSEVDELRKWTMEKLKAEVAKVYKMDVGLPITDEYIMKYFAGISDEDIAELIKVKEKEVKASIKSTSKTKEALALRTSASAGLASTGATGAQAKTATSERAEDNGNGEDRYLEIATLIGQLKELVDLELHP